MINNNEIAKISHSIIDFFIEECRKNPHRMNNTDLTKYIIYNYD